MADGFRGGPLIQAGAGVGIKGIRFRRCACSEKMHELAGRAAEAWLLSAGIRAMARQELPRGFKKRFNSDHPNLRTVSPTMPESPDRIYA